MAAGIVGMGMLAGVAAAQRITIDVGKPIVEISPQMYGLFIEDINFAADGGLYPELVKNRSFEFDEPRMGWHVLGGLRGSDMADLLILRDEQARPRNPRWARLRAEAEGYGLHNEGFRAMGVREGAQYRFSLDARTVAGQPAIDALRAELVDGAGKTIGTARVEGFGPDWQHYEVMLTSRATAEDASLNVWAEGTGQLDVDMLSLFPVDTYGGRRNGLRPDLVQMLADMHPGFLRFPGGCIVEGRNLSQAYRWKDTIGPIDQRVTNINRWNKEFAHRLTPDYYQSYGLGFYEYFLLCEDIGAEPMPILNCGMACQFNTAELVPLNELAPYVQDALDLIEFANGPADSRWGSVRAEMGHPEPFGMKMLGVGNEQWGPQYIERYKIFADAIKARYLDVELVAPTGSDPTIFPNGPAEVAYLWDQWRQLKPEFVDEHFYRNPEWFLANTDHYDDYDRNEPPVFVGEYAAQSGGVADPNNRNTWQCALYEAAFMTGLERNADVVRMTCYAPLFAHEDAWQWRPDLIWFDNLKSYGSVNYYVQKLFSLNRGTHLVAAEVADAPALDDGTQAFHASATIDRSAGEVIVKIVNATGEPQTAAIELKDAGRLGAQARVVTLAAGRLDAENTLEQPEAVVPAESTAPIAGPEFSYEVEPYSLTILRVPATGASGARLAAR